MGFELEFVLAPLAVDGKSTADVAGLDIAVADVAELDIAARKAEFSDSMRTRRRFVRLTDTKPSRIVHLMDCTPTEFGKSDSIHDPAILEGF